MPKVSKQTGGKIGLLAAVLYIIGNVVGVGIFFKNNTVFKLNDANAIGVLLAWIISIFIVLCMALSFAEVSTCKMKNKNAGLGGWSEQFCGRGFGRYAKTGFSLVFFPVNTFAILFFAGEAILNCFAPLVEWEKVSNYNFGTGTTAMVFGIGALLFTMFMVLNYLKSKTMGKIGSIISFVKFLPILMVVVCGIVFGSIYGETGWGSQANNLTIINSKSNNGINIFGIISAVPAILFSFEGYISIGNISGDIENSEKNLSLSVVLGVAIISVLYLAVTIGCISANCGDVYQLMSILKDRGQIVPYRILTIAISIFIFICLIGCTNGMSKGGISAFQSLCEDGSLFKSRALINAKPGNKMFAGLVWFYSIVMIWWTILVIPSSILNTDAIADGSSTSMVLFLYVIYGLTIFGGLVNRKTHKVSVNKQKIFPVTAVIGVLACIFLVVYVGFIQFMAAPISNGLFNLDGDGSGVFKNIKAGWGMFVNAPNCLGIVRQNDHYVLKNIETLAWFWGMTIFMALMPIFNDLLLKASGNPEHQRLIWQSK